MRIGNRIGSGRRNLLSTGLGGKRSTPALRYQAAMPRLRSAGVRSAPPALCASSRAWTKVSDEFTVPLCRAHYRELHRAEQGSELVDNTLH